MSPRVIATNFAPRSVRFGRHTSRAGIAAVAGLALSLACATALPPADDGSAIAPTPGAGPMDSDQSAGAGTLAVAEDVPLEVYVRDADGQPVHGLTRNDFELIVTDSVGSGIDVSAHGRDLPVPGDRMSDQDRLQVIIYVDEANLAPAARNGALTAVAAFLDGALEPSDEVMLVSRADDLLLREPLTSDITRVSRALRLMQLEAAPALIRRRADQFAQSTRRIEDAATGEIAYEIAANYAHSRRLETVQGLRALETSILDLASSSARKVLLYVGDAGSTIPGEDLFRQVHRRFPDHPTLIYQMEYDLSQRVRTVAGKANSHRVTIYAVQSGEVRRAKTDGRSPHGDAAGGSITDSLAQDTGGLTVPVADRSAGLERIADDLRKYNTLLAPGHIFTNRRYHWFEVRLKSAPEGWTLRHRDGHRDRSRQNRMHDRLLAALRLDQQSNPLGLQLMLGRQTKDDSGALLVPLVVSLPHKRLTFETVDGEVRSLIRLWLVTRTASGTSRVVELLHEFRLDPGEVHREGDFDLTQRILLQPEPGYIDLAIAVRDELGGAVSTIRRGYWLSAPGTDGPNDGRAPGRLPLFGRHAAVVE